jgi:hypothetical protein
LDEDNELAYLLRSYSITKAIQPEGNVLLLSATPTKCIPSQGEGGRKSL